MFTVTNSGIRRNSDGAVFPKDDTHPLWPEYIDWLRSGGAPDVDQTPALSDMQAAIGSAVQAVIDNVCRSGVPYFRDIFSARGYVNDPNPAYHARAVALRDWSSAIWTTLDEIEADVIAGNRPAPSIAQILAELPSPP